MVRGDLRKQCQFQEHFAKIYGDRWHALREALLRPNRKVALWNRHTKLPRPAPESHGFHERTSPGGLVYYELQDPKEEFPPPARDESGIASYYLMDLASLLVVDALKVEPFSRVLDLCAAPGGKSVAISQHLAVSSGLTANETNGERCKRLKRVLHEYIPAEAHDVTVTQKDATTWHMPSSFDRVLLDAPCSSERHLLAQTDGLARWTPASSKSQAEVQLSLLLRGLETLRVGGLLVYSTCSISPVENDNVIMAALQRTRVGVEVVGGASFPSGGEPTPVGGNMALPDTANGIGPMYCCVLRKTSEHRLSSESDEDSEST